uniref:SWIM-type domain-containing protein n=1 Tax=Chenopodium quinoa TaxID=63459 RepID=A0A803LPW9_CHEQI
MVTQNDTTKPSKARPTGELVPVVGTVEENVIRNNEDIVDLDDEVVSEVGSDDEGPVYPEFNPKEGLKSFTSVIMPTVLKMVHRGLQQVSNMRVSQADLMEFEVDDLEYTYVVNLETKSCSCNRWTLMGIPYWHALAYIQLRRLDIENFIHRAYHVETYTKAYAPTFKAMPGHQQWEVTPYPRPLPLNKCPSPPIDKPKRQPRRPKKVEAAGQAVAGKPVAGQAAGATSSH